MSKEEDRLLREQINSSVNSIQQAGFKAPTERAYIFKRLPGVIYSPDEKRAGQVRSLQQANKVRLDMGLEPLTSAEYRMELKGLATNPQLSPDGIRDYHARQIADFLNKDIKLTENERDKLFNLVHNMSDKELSDLIKGYAGTEGSDAYTNVHKWIEENVLGDRDK